ncbi:hypothetical protein QGP82_12615 [Leptothoe sp. LEGE 181152]|nr:hypothetical protein [Leptothoe sp. LEGE 181152]
MASLPGMSQGYRTFDFGSFLSAMPITMADQGQLSWLSKRIVDYPEININ